MPGFFEYEFVIRALAAGLIVAVACGILGVFLVQRGASMMGDALAHIAFSGIALGLLTNLYPFGTALVVAIAGALGINALQRRGIVLSDTAVAIFFTLGLAFGILIISMGRGFTVDVYAYLFGSLATVTTRDLWFVSALGFIVIGALLAFFKEWVALTLDEEGARVAGLRTELLNAVLAVCTAVVIVVSARVVGALLVSALVVLPGSAATQWGRGIVRVTILSVLIGCASVFIGFWMAFEFDLPAGPAIATLAGITFGAAVLTKRLPARLRALAVNA